MSNYVSNHRLSESNKSFVNQLSTIAIPNSVEEVLADQKWKAVMNEEMKSLQKNETWELVEYPPGKKPVGCHWIYIVKYKADGNIEQFKARLVAKGYTQTYGNDYTDIFVPITKINTVRVLLSLAANLDWPLQQFEVKNVFLHGELSEEIYMNLPPRCMVSEKQCQKMCKLKKSLYGLKQSLRAWFGRFTKSMRAFGYHQSNSDHTLFLKKQHSKITAFIVYVDDMVVTGNDPKERKALQNYLSREFEMKDLVMRILRYLKNALGKGILFAKNVDHQSIEVYIDADWVNTVDDRRSTSSYFTFVGGNLVTWKSKKQNVIARSSAEAEFRDMTLGLCETLWLRLLLQDLGYLSRQPIRLFYDNKDAYDIAHNPV
ncbi:hypothetical protein VitviT2T_004223 [Vitis vinifera]|uniref:Reverse transcriptase Ty1/copia-type domain-containing protein n=1 Tax=Vitis vinifera TaxID=29760 RepID=A0ABY9BQF7_VITVI|nr:hypothetical protein VitviT2T_004223 [Vitis vinifera]